MMDSVADVGKQFETVLFALSGTKQKISLNFVSDPIFQLSSRTTHQPGVAAK
jgi:hypothetical protein